ncbi:serine/threonine protein phosphatase, partial [Salmonella enterica]
QGITLPWRSQLYFIAIITKYLLATDEIRYLQQSTFTKQENLHTLSFYICPG